MKKTIIVGIILISLLFLGGCDYLGEICSQINLPEVLCGVISCVFGEAGLQNMANNPEVRNFLQTHPDAEITMTLIPKSNVLKNMGTLSMELGTDPIVKDYIKLGLKDGSNTLTVMVDADTKELSYVKLGVLEETPTSPREQIPPKEEEIIPKEEEKAPAPPKEEETTGPAKEAETELSDADLAHIDRLKVACDRGSVSSCIVLKNNYGID